MTTSLSSDLTFLALLALIGQAYVRRQEHVGQSHHLHELWVQAPKGDVSDAADAALERMHKNEGAAKAWAEIAANLGTAYMGRPNDAHYGDALRAARADIEGKVNALNTLVPGRVLRPGAPLWYIADRHLPAYRLAYAEILTLVDATIVQRIYP